MSAEAPYFPDVEFTELTEITPPRGRAEKFLSRFQREPRIYFDQRVELDDFLDQFKDELSVVSDLIGANLTLDGINVRILKRKQLIKALKNPKRLEGVHGEGILDAIVGNCVENPEGGFTLNIVQGRTDHIVDEGMFREIVAHEYGHTLEGELHPSPMLEELKAYSFESLFFSTRWRDYSFVSYYVLDGKYKNLTHDVARNRLNQLRDRGFPYGAIIAHLIGVPFGHYRPDSNMQIPQ